MSLKDDYRSLNEIKKLKKEFNTNLRKAKLLIKNGDAESALKVTDECIKNIDDIEKIVNSIPDNVKRDKITNIISYISGIIVYFGTLSITAQLRHKVTSSIADKKVELIDQDHKEREKMDDTIEKVKKMGLDEYVDFCIEREPDEEEKSYYKTKHFANNCYDSRVDDITAEEEEKYRKRTIETGEKIKKLNKISGKVNGSISKIGSNAAGVIVSKSVMVSIKPVKQKAKEILKKCRGQLENLKRYINKAAKMRDSLLKESFDDTLNDLYESFTEGYIDEFEYDTLIDHLLN